MKTLIYNFRIINKIESLRKKILIAKHLKLIRKIISNEVQFEEKIS